MAKSIELEPYRIAIHERICRICHDSRDDGSCRRPEDDPCALITHVEQLVQAVLQHGVSDDVGGYVASLRHELCPTCRQDDGGTCELRHLADCAADAYIIPVIEVIEEVAASRGDRA